MRTINGETITRTDPYRHKFNDALTEYLYADIEAWADRASGDAECPIGWFAAVGSRRILRGDERGFVWIERYNDTRGRDQVMAALDAYYGEWADDDYDVDDPTAEDDHAARVETRGQYVAYVIACDDDQCEAFDYDAWTMRGAPRGPIGGAQ